jgi:hypothetical protein
MGVFRWDGRKYANAIHPPLIDAIVPQETENVCQGMKESLKGKMEYHNESVKALAQRIGRFMKRSVYPYEIN